MSMQGKVVVITGANVGIGFETAVGVAEQGATTVLACRNQAKAEAAAKEVTARTWNDDVHVVPLDLADLASVRKASDDILAGWDRLDVLVNNAGGTWTQRQFTAQSIEYTIGVNHLGPFYLTNLLLPRLRAGSPARVVCVSSFGHHFARYGMGFDDLQSERRYEGMEAYCKSKLANVLFVRELARRRDGDGRDGERRPPRLGAEQLRHGRRHHRFGRPGHARPASLPDQPAPRRPDVGLSRLVARGGGPDRRVLGPVEARPHEPERPRRRGGAAAVGRERAAPGDGGVPARLSGEARADRPQPDRDRSPAARLPAGVSSLTRRPRS